MSTSNQNYSILVSCDQSYYDQWTVPLLESIRHHNPWLTLRCNLVNPDMNYHQLDDVLYTTEFIDFSDELVRISYLQCSRFLALSKIPLDENVITLDCDTICTRSFTEEKFASLFDGCKVFQHPKKKRWLAGMVVFGNSHLRIELLEAIKSEPLKEWLIGRDQLMLNRLASHFDFQDVGEEWISIGKNKKNSAFITLKGEQKTSKKYLHHYSIAASQ